MTGIVTMVTKGVEAMVTIVTLVLGITWVAYRIYPRAILTELAMNLI